MESLELLERLNKKLIDAQKRVSICYADVAEQDKLKGDVEHELFSNYRGMSAKEKRKWVDDYVKQLDERHQKKYEHEELSILADLLTTPNVKKAIDESLNKLRKLDQKVEVPIYYYRSEKKKEEQGEFIGNK